MRHLRDIRKRVTDGRTDGQTDGRMDGWTDGWTDPLTEMDDASKNCAEILIFLLLVLVRLDG